MKTPLAKLSSMRVGGIAPYIPVRSLVDLIPCKTATDSTCPRQNAYVLGTGSNVVAASTPLSSAVLGMRSLRGVSFLSSTGASQVQVMAGEEVNALCRQLSSRGIAGMEKLYGLPATVGGALWMNANCFKVSISTYVKRALVCVRDASEVKSSRSERRSGAKAQLTPYADLASLTQAWPVLEGRMGEMSADDKAYALKHLACIELDAADFSYKHSPFQNHDWVIIAAEFELAGRARPTDLWQTMHETICYRIEKQHFCYPSAGSVFKNDYSYGISSGEILDDLGLKGKRIGGAMVSEWHANFIINKDAASGEDVKALIDHMQKLCQEKRGLLIEPEVVLWGF